MTLVFLHVIVFVAAAFQTAAGIGFALIAGPMLLILFPDGSAVQTSILLNLFMSLILAPMLIGKVDRASLRALLVGLLMGLPFGVGLYLLADARLLKLIAAVLVLLALAPFFRQPPQEQTEPKRLVTTATGAIGGIMSGFLAMPGPALSFYLSGLRGLPRDVTRATIYALFVFAYGVSLMMHGLTSGLSMTAIQHSFSLAPATALGMVVGMALAHRLSQTMFRRIIAMALLATAITLLLSAAS